MWLITTLGAYSAVCPHTNAGRGEEIDTSEIMVRARVLEHLTALQEKFSQLAGAKILESAHADYRYRIIVSKAAWADAVNTLVLETKYDNFKNGVAETHSHGSPYVSCLHETWAVLRRLQKFLR